MRKLEKVWTHSSYLLTYESAMWTLTLTLPVNTFLYRRYKETSVCIGVIALMLIVVQLYISIIVTSIQGPRTIIYWLGCAQLMVTLYFLHLPFEYSSEISKDERFLVDDHFTDEEEVIFSTRIDSAASEGYPGFEYYGTIVPQLSGPGGASPVSADEVLVGTGQKRMLDSSTTLE